MKQSKYPTDSALRILGLALAFLVFKQTAAQSIGYHPQFNFGFNPYYSTTFGYGLGLPFGAYNMSPSKNPLLLGLVSAAAPFPDKAGFMSKKHAKAFLEKLASYQLINLPAHLVGRGNLKDKLQSLKYPAYALSPYTAGYGFGNHYGSAVFPNNPYKGAHTDFYDKNYGIEAYKDKLMDPLKISHTNQQQIASSEVMPSSVFAHYHNKPIGPYLKPILKTGAFLTSLALLGKKILAAPVRLDPTGMILPDVRP